MSSVTEDTLGPLAARRSTRTYADYLRGRTVVIFGGSSGIGREVRRLAQGLGADVFSFSRSTTGTLADNPAHVRAALDQVQRATGRIDAIVVTAGLRHRRGERLGRHGGDLVETDEHAGHTEDPIATNQIPVTVAVAGLPYLRLTQGQLLLFSSSLPNRGRASYAVCSSAKAAVVNLTQALADEWAQAEVRVNCINPEMLCCADVALASVDVLASDLTGQVVEVRLIGPASIIAATRPAAEPSPTVARRRPHT